MSDVLAQRYEERRLALKAIVDSLGRGGSAEVARRIGRQASYVNRLLYPPGKDGAKRIGDALVVAITHAYPNWLATGAQTDPDMHPHERPGRQSRVGPYISFDAYPVPADAGAAALTRRLSLATADVQRRLGFVPERGRIQLFTQRGPAMRPSIEDGDVAFIDTAMTDVVADDCYLVEMAKTLQLKRLQRRGDQVWVISANEQFPSWPLTEESGVTVRGKLVLRLALHAT